MNFCEYVKFGFVGDTTEPTFKPCGDPATVKIGGKYYCEKCADVREIEILCGLKTVGN